MAKLSLSPAPTFKAKVGIPVAGGPPADVEFVFKHRTKDDIAGWLKDKKQSDEDAVQWCVVGWDLDDEFNAENVKRLVQNYVGSSAAIVAAYLDEVRGARAKN